MSKRRTTMEVLRAQNEAGLARLVRMKGSLWARRDASALRLKALEADLAKVQGAIATIEAVLSAHTPTQDEREEMIGGDSEDQVR